MQIIMVFNSILFYFNFNDLLWVESNVPMDHLVISKLFVQIFPQENQNVEPYSMNQPDFDWLFQGNLTFIASKKNPLQHLEVKSHRKRRNLNQKIRAIEGGIIFVVYAKAVCRISIFVWLRALLKLISR